MIKRRHIFFGLILILSILLVGCKDSDHAQPDETVKTTEEYLSSEMTKSILLGLSKDLEKTTNVNLVRNGNEDNGTYKSTYYFVGEGASRIIGYTSEYSYEGNYYASKGCIWKDGDQYICASSEDSTEDGKEDHQKQYFFMSEEEYQEEVGDSNPYNTSLLVGCIDMLSDDGCIVSGKKITKGDLVTYEINVRNNDSGKSVEEYNIVAEGSKIISMVNSWTDNDGERSVFEVNIEYNFKAQVPSLEDYTLYEEEE